MAEKAVVICPGRGTYTKSDLGYLQRYRPGSDTWIATIDSYLQQRGMPTVSALDAAPQFNPPVHTAGENASTLIYACSMADFHAIDKDRFEIVAVTGNSLGWYTALAAGGALPHANAVHLISTMGSMMKDGVVGGQLVYPMTREDWTIDPERAALVGQALQEVNQLDLGGAYPSIRFGGYAVIGGAPAAIKYLMGRLPKVDERYPMQLVNHGAFHTPLLAEIAEKALLQLEESLFQKPIYPMVDGRGHIWQPHSTDLSELHRYTLTHQVTKTYDFWTALTVSLKEFAPDRLILLGPGATSGGAVGQILVNEGWFGMRSKADFTSRQQHDPFLIAMGLPEQRQRAVAG